MTQSEVQTLLRQGIAAAKGGQTARARQALLQVVEIDEKNVTAWLWLSAVVDDPTDKFTCLHNVLALEPHNKPARVGLERLEQQAGLPKPPPGPAPPASEPQPSSHPPPPAMTDQTDTSMIADLAQGTPTMQSSLAPEAKREILKSSVTPQQSSDIFCPFCQQPHSRTATRCEHCQLPLVIDCPACDARVDVEATNCPECGQAMGNYRHKSVYFARLARAYYERKQYRKAVAIWQVVELVNPNYPHLQLRLAEALAGADRPKQAIGSLRKVLAEDPGQEAASMALGKILDKLSRWDESVAVYQAALTVSPDSARLNLALGWTLIQQKELNKGLHHLRQATRLDSDNGMAWFRLGQVYEATERKQPAGEAYRRAADLLPKDKLIQKKAQQLAEVLTPELPVTLATGWFEFLRQLTGPILICVVVALLDSGMRPWWIPWTGWVALIMGVLGTFLWTSGASLPRNPLICLVLGHKGLTSSQARTSMALCGGVFWLLALGIVLYPIGQLLPEVPEWILNFSSS